MTTASPALAVRTLGLGGLASTPVHDLPTVSLTAPTGTVSTGGPNLTVSWTYAQAQGVPQGTFRVLITNAAGSTTYYDSGVLSGTDSSRVVNAVAEGVPTDTTGSALHVTVFVTSADGPAYLANTGPHAFDIQWGVVTVTVTAPTGVIDDSSTTATWTFASTRGFPEGFFRVRLLYLESSTVLYDSGFTAGTDLSFAIPFTLSDGSNYTVEVTAKNSMGVPSSPESTDFQVDLPSLAVYDINDDVGSVYEIGINGRGLMLYDDRDADQEDKWERSTGPLDPQRLATSPTPLSEAVERYLFSAGSDFKGGAGQLFADRPDSAADAYLDSDGVDVFSRRGQVSLLNSVAQEVASSYAALRLVVVGTDLYAQTGAKQLTRRDNPGGSNTVFSVAAAGTISDLTTDGTRWYACDGTGAWRNTSAADPGAAWSSIDLQYLGFGGGRVCGSYASSGTAPNVFTTLTEAGAEEVPSGRLVLPVGWTIDDFTSGSGFIFFAAHSGNRGAIYSWDFSADAPILAWDLPPGEIPTSVQWSQGNVLVQAKKAQGAVSHMLVYRCVVQDSLSQAGTLTPSLLLDVGRDESPPLFDYGATGATAALGRQVFFAWPFMGGATGSGVGTVDLSTSGYSKWFKSSGGGQVSSIDVWQGRLVFAVRGDGVWLKSATSYVSSGWLKTSLADGNSVLDKVVDQVTVSTAPLSALQSVDVAYSLDGTGSYTAFPSASLSGAGAKRKVTDLDARSSSVGLQVTLNGPGTSTPVLYFVDVRYHALGLADTFLTIPVDCGDQLGGLNGQPLRENGVGVGAVRARWLESLAQTRVSFQDIDWPLSGVTETYEVYAVKVRKVGVWDRHRRKEGLRQVALVTLRKRAK